MYNIWKKLYNSRRNKKNNRRLKTNYTMIKIPGSNNIHNRETMATTTYIGNTPTGAGIVDTGEASKKYATTI